MKVYRVVGFISLTSGAVAVALRRFLAARAVPGARRRCLRTTPVPSRAPVDWSAHASAARVEVQQLTDEQLCARWRGSYLAMHQPRRADQLMRTVRQRQLCLDELRRRDRAGFDMWLASNPRAAGNPLPYLRGQRRGRSSIDWDGLVSGLEER